jgi:hypothetical protein
VRRAALVMEPFSQSVSAALRCTLRGLLSA